MLRKLLFICLTLFAFTSLSAQTFISFSPTCGSNSFEFEQVANVNGKVAYASMNPTSGNMDGLGISGVPDPTASTNLTIQWDGSQWLFIDSGVGTVFTNSYTGALVPDSGWVSDGDPCGLAVILSLYDNNSAVLNVDKEIYSKMALYPNPSNGFIQISNLDAPSRVVITNIAGQIVKNVKVDINNNRIDIQELSKGFYFVEIEGKKTIKLIKQ